MTDYLESARVLLDRAFPAAEDVALAQAHALVSVAESLAVLAGDLREEQMRTESLRGALAEARREAEESAEIIDRVWKIINGDGTDIARISAIHEAVTR